MREMRDFSSDAGDAGSRDGVFLSYPNPRLCLAPTLPLIELLLRYLKTKQKVDALFK